MQTSIECTQSCCAQEDTGQVCRYLWSSCRLSAPLYHAWPWVIFMIGSIHVTTIRGPCINFVICIDSSGPYASASKYLILIWRIKPWWEIMPREVSQPRTSESHRWTETSLYRHETVDLGNGWGGGYQISLLVCIHSSLYPTWHLMTPWTCMFCVFTLLSTTLPLVPDAFCIQFWWSLGHRISAHTMLTLQTRGHSPQVVLSTGSNQFIFITVLHKILLCFCLTAWFWFGFLVVFGCSYYPKVNCVPQNYPFINPVPTLYTLFSNLSVSFFSFLPLSLHLHSLPLYFLLSLLLSSPPVFIISLFPTTSNWT